METRLEIFMGILCFLCFALFFSVVVARAVKWIQLKLRLRREEKELGEIVQKNRRWENLEKELDLLADPATDPKPWQPNKKPFPLPNDEIVEAPHTMWCPKCGSHKRHLAHATGGIPHLKCEDCGQRYKQIVVANPAKPGPVRWDRNISEASPAAPSPSEGHWPGVVIWDEIAPYPPEEIHIPNKGGWNETADEPVTFGGGNFGGSGAGTSYEAPGDSDSSARDSDSSARDSDSSSDYTTSNDD